MLSTQRSPLPLSFQEGTRLNLPLLLAKSVRWQSHPQKAKALGIEGSCTIYYQQLDIVSHPHRYQDRGREPEREFSRPKG